MSAALAIKDGGPNPLVEGEFAFSAANFKMIAAMLYDTAGITLSESKAVLVYSRLAKRVRTLGMSNFDEYCRLLASPAGEDERGRMLNALTTNLTRFFREPHHFDHLRDKVLLPLASQIRSGARVRIWSGGCSSGQEPYSIALTLLSAIPQAPELDVKILATDIDTNMIAMGKAGVYADEQVDSIPPALRDKWMSRDAQDPDKWRVGEAARSLVTFNALNLMGSWPMRGPFQAVFCRNVVIYFDDHTQEKLWTRMAALLPVGGHLYIGHSERLGPVNDKFESDGLTVYRKLGGGRS